MGEQGLICGWQDKYLSLWGHQPIRLGHRLHTLDLFGHDGLARLIESYPREHFSIVQTSDTRERRVWREGELGGLSGREVIAAIARGRLWLNMRRLNDVDSRYAHLLEQLFDEMQQLAPGFVTLRRGCGLLISSPRSRVHYHADLPGQGLLQIAGRKRLYLYPAETPFISRELLERIAVFDLEVDIPYHSWFDEYALTYDLEPGQMVYWPTNAPHRVENEDCLNISLTVDFLTEPIRRAQIVTLANGLLRHRFGWEPHSRSIRGPAYWTKAVLQKALRNGSWIRQARRAGKTIEFRLDRAAPGAVVDLIT
jgi:Cupin-like domain